MLFIKAYLIRIFPEERRKHLRGKLYCHSVLQPKDKL